MTIDTTGFEEMLIDEFIVWREEVTSKDEIGGRARNFFKVDTYKGRLSEIGAKGREAVRAGQDIVYIDHQLFCETQVKIKKSDYVEIDNEYYQVMYQKNPSEEIDHHLEIGLQIIQPANSELYGL